jgi:hypothetical protein
MPSKRKLSPAGSKPPRARSRPMHEKIRFRAYQIYLDRGGEHGRDVEDWLKAERELLKKRKKAQAKAPSG